uniref:Uncharacterized protein n=1 Tax=Rhizophora mucronata TaxID=61149 RepID=A0A2P2NKV9_RHIMU
MWGRAKNKSGSWVCIWLRILIIHHFSHLPLLGPRNFQIQLPESESFCPILIHRTKV